MRYTLMVIETFRHKGLKLLFLKGDRSKIRPDIATKAAYFLSLLNEARTVEDVNVVGFSLHALRGDLNTFWSVSVSRNHRIIFRFENGGAWDVDLVDYH